MTVCSKLSRKEYCSLYHSAFSNLNLLLESAGVPFGLITEMLMSLGGPGWLNVITGWNSLCVHVCKRENGCVYACVCLSLSLLGRATVLNRWTVLL